MAVDPDAGFDGQIVLDEPMNSGAPADTGLLTAKFVHYPGSQQLIVWLPSSGYEGFGELRLTGPAGVVEVAPVRDRLNGSVQILWDTFFWPPGDYRLEIDRTAGGRHQLGLRKLQAGEPPPVPEPPTPEPELFERNDRGEIIYRDGAGAIIPDADLILRETVRRDMARRFGRRLEFEGNFRGGTIHYLDGDRRISFWHEMAGGGYHMFIDIPPPSRWESSTGAPLSEREEIVRFVAEETRRRQAPNWSFEITETEIRYF